MTTIAKIGGKSRPLRYTFGVTRKTCIDLDCSFTDLETYPEKSAADFFNYIVTLTYHALLAGAKAKGITDTNEITIENIGDWFDDMTPEEFANFQNLQAGDPKKKEVKPKE